MKRKHNYCYNFAVKKKKGLSKYNTKPRELMLNKKLSSTT